ncbi:type II secretion system minor pseudopilin GspI [Catenovulum sp. 2E275]|uniref:type II secretion system minor pseudopilin GspI n=1 Tax=Catenovulum sp. 2E275 TaxID=2980497 RepID=UPI0021D298B4|nr:type II secretion system minor pseudopilin GspI [Catenovulum sp. 2E275]MCU4674389.1 type II secretion system minor pseudopilin GspI [Catenovulum sp. 2E275]
MKIIKNKKGFTILEVIVAMAILATAGVAIVQSSSVHISNQDKLQQVMMANWIASNRLNTILIEREWPVQNSQKGEAEMAGATWYWQQKRVKTNFGDELVAVTISVYQDADYQEYITELTSYIGKP